MDENQDTRDISRDEYFSERGFGGENTVTDGDLATYEQGQIASNDAMNEALFNDFQGLGRNYDDEQARGIERRKVAGAAAIVNAYRGGGNGMSSRGLSDALRSALGEQAVGMQVLNGLEGNDAMLNGSIAIYGYKPNQDGTRGFGVTGILNPQMQLRLLQDARIGESGMPVRRQLWGNLRKSYTEDQLRGMGLNNPDGPSYAGSGVTISGQAARMLFGRPRQRSSVSAFGANGQGGFTNYYSGAETGYQLAQADQGSRAQAAMQSMGIAPYTAAGRTRRMAGAPTTIAGTNIQLPGTQAGTAASKAATQSQKSFYSDKMASSINEQLAGLEDKYADGETKWSEEDRKRKEKLTAIRDMMEDAEFKRIAGLAGLDSQNKENIDPRKVMETRFGPQRLIQYYDGNGERVTSSGWIVNGQVVGPDGKAVPDAIAERGYRKFDDDPSDEVAQKVLERRNLYGLKQKYGQPKEIKYYDANGKQVSGQGWIIDGEVVDNEGYYVDGATLDKPSQNKANAGFGKRRDGTDKGNGWLGVQKLPNGGVATEYTVGVNIDGKEVDIPTLVPGLSKEQVDKMVNDIIPNGKKVPDDIMNVAIEHAHKMMSAGKSVFAPESDAQKMISPVGNKADAPTASQQLRQKNGSAAPAEDSIFTKDKADLKRWEKPIRAVADAVKGVNAGMLNNAQRSADMQQRSNQAMIEASERAADDASEWLNKTDRQIEEERRNRADMREMDENERAMERIDDAKANERLRNIASQQADETNGRLADLVAARMKSGRDGITIRKEIAADLERDGVDPSDAKRIISALESGNAKRIKAEMSMNADVVNRINEAVDRANARLYDADAIEERAKLVDGFLKKEDNRRKAVARIANEKKRTDMKNKSLKEREAYANSVLRAYESGDVDRIRYFIENESDLDAVLDEMMDK